MAGKDAKQGAGLKSVLLGIDPGVQTGVAVFQDGALSELLTVAPHEIESTLDKLMPRAVVVEDSRIQSHAWNARSKKTIGAALATARSLGQVDGYCALIEGLCKAKGIELYRVSPAMKGAKRGSENFEAVTGWSKPSNQHTRDAAMVAWTYRRAAL